MRVTARHRSRSDEADADVHGRAASVPRAFHHSAFSPERVAGEREASISVCLPARNERSTIGPILEQILTLVGAGVIDQVAVVDDSEDGTADIARALGAEVHAQSALCPELGPVNGKGDAMWRALTVLRGDVVCYLDADSEAFGPHYATALGGVVAIPGRVRFAKAFYRRPFRSAEGLRPTGGGRVTELTAKPLLAAFYPELGTIRQPLAGEIGARRDLLMGLPFLCGYAVDVALLIDACRAVGADGVAEVDLDVRQNRHRPLEELGPMAHAVLGGVLSRLRAEGRLAGVPDAEPAVRVVERPPMDRYLAGHLTRQAALGRAPA
jgi:glucosyl-3-phosphoglycerate synthase